MENMPITQLAGWKFYNLEDHVRFGKWATEVFYPVWMKSPYITGINRYQIIKENPEYCTYISTYHFINLKAFINHWKNPESANIIKDMVTTWGNKRDVLWGYLYQPERSIYNTALAESIKKELNSDDAPCIHIEAFDLSREQEGEYYSWFTDMGDEVFMSRVMKRSGILGYDHFRLLSVGWSYNELEYVTPKERFGPPYVLIFYFDGVQHCLDFTNSRELAAFRVGLTPYFPEGLKLKWNVDYKLIGSWKRDK